MLLFFASAETRFWASMVFLPVAALGYLGHRLTKGFAGGYSKANLGANLKGALFIIHGLSSLVLALILPNNYLVRIDFFRKLYQESELWIAVSILILLFMFLLAVGALFTILTKRKVRKSV
jgi:hypothetical protein